MNGAFYIGVDLGGTVIKAVAMNHDGSVLIRRSAPTEAQVGRERLLHRIATIIEDVSDEARAAYPGLRDAKVGLSVPGVIDAATGTIEFTVALTPDWNGFAASAALQQRTGLPAALINDAQAATLGEHVAGGGRGLRDFVCITIGTGVGGGLVLNNQLYTGSRGMSGVLGHTTVVPDGARCGCGNRGCLELYASGTAIARAAQHVYGSAQAAPSLRDQPWSAAVLAERAQAGDAKARGIFEEAGAYIGIALGNVVCTLNPQAIVVGGGVSDAGDLLLDPIRRELRRRTAVFSEERGGVEVIQSPLGRDAGAIGSAAWIAQGDHAS